MKLYLLSIIMATLADLFVSYKSVVPDDKPTVQAHTVSPNVNLVKSRFQQLEEARLAQQQAKEDEKAEAEELDEDDLDFLDDLEGLEGNEDIDDDSFHWYVAEAYSPSLVHGVPDETAAISNFTPTGTIAKYNRGNLQAEIEDLFSKHGINVRVTSGKRPAGAAGKAGKNSHHVYGNAADIVPGQGETFNSIKKKMLQTPEIVQFFYENGLGVIDETDPAVMEKTHARGKHFHIGPDKLGLTTWSQWLNTPTSKIPSDTASTKGDKAKEKWTKDIYNAFQKGLKEEFGSEYKNDTYKKIAAFMTYQAAEESGYGDGITDFNYGGHKKNGQRVKYKDMDQFVKAHIQTLKKWDFMNSESLEDYVNSLYRGQYRYNDGESPQQYYSKIKGTTNRINGYLGISLKFGGKFTNIRQYYEKTFS